MRTIFRVIGMTSLLFSAALAQAQFVKGNEAVRVTAAGASEPELPPLPRRSSGAAPKVCGANDGCHAGPWHMVETANGLQECTEPFARATTCRPSTYGTRKLSRVWVIKHQGKWLWCQKPELTARCVDMQARPPNNLPLPAFQ